MSKNSENKYGQILGIIGNILLWVTLLAYFIIVPFYFVNGYEKIATYKYTCFMTISKYAAIVLGVFILLYLSTWGFNKEERAVFKPLWMLDIGMLLFIAFSFVSYKASPYQAVTVKAEGEWFYEGSLYGAKGWFMGFIIFLILVFLYFAISRFFKYTNLIWIPILLAAAVAFAWGILNRYGIYPIEMEFASASFISSFGNINWFAGFVSILAPISVGLFFSSTSKLRTCLIIVPLILSHAIVLLNNSDSIVFGYAIMFFALLIYSLDNKEKLARFARTLFSFTCVGMGLLLLDKAFPGVKEGTSQLADVFSKGFTAIAIFVVSFLFVVLTGLFEDGKLNYSEKAGRITRRVLLITAAVIVVLVIVLIWVNTATGGALPIIGSSALFTFDRYWGSSRGATWSIGVMLFKHLSFGRKLIGVGPDMFYYGIKDIEPVYVYCKSIFENSRLTNAHNEIITMLDNIGILGTASFIFMVVSAVKVFIKSSKERPYIIAFALSVICYLANNIFSFQQITGTPFFFLVIGIGAAAVATGKAK